MVYFYPADETPGCTKQVRITFSHVVILKEMIFSKLTSANVGCLNIFGKIIVDSRLESI